MKAAVVKFQDEDESNFKSIQRSRSKAFCHLCRCRVGLMDDELAVNYLQADFYAIERLLEAGVIHRIHNSKGKVLLCRKALQEAKLRYTPRFVVLKQIV